MKPKPVLMLLALTLASLACTVNLAIPQKTPGASVEEAILIPVPDAKNISLQLDFGAGDLNLQPGAESALLEGTATYNIPDLKPEVVQEEEGKVILKQGEYRVDGLPSFEDMENRWDLRLGAKPLALRINAGAYEGRFDFGGLALTSLAISDGAADVEVDFSAPNGAEMSLFTYNTGASNVTLRQLGNANFQSLVFECGAGNYTLDFSGDFQRDASVVIRSGMSNLTIRVPAGLNATLVVESGLANVQVPPGWQTDASGLYRQEGEGASLTLKVEMGAGNLQITE